MKRRLLIQLGLLLALMVYTASSLAAAEGAAVKEIGTKTLGGLEVTLISAPPRSQAQMKEMMKQMGKAEMKQMMEQKEMGGMMGGMTEMRGMREMPSEPATHYIGVIIRDRKTQKVLPNLKVTLTAKGPVAREVEFMSMPGSYAQNISLPSGKYDISVKIEFPKEKKKPVEVSFRMEA